MKINFIIPGQRLTGGILVIERYAKELARRGHKVTLYAPWCAYNVHRSKYKLKNLYIQIKSTIKEIILFSLKINYKEKNLYRIKRPWKISNQTIDNADIVIATAWPTAYDVNKLDERKGTKFYFIQDFEIWDNKELAIKTYLFNLKKIVISNWINEQLKYNECEQGTIINNGIDLGEFDCKIKKYNHAENVQCLMLYHHLEKKGVKDGIEAFERIKYKNKSVKLCMFGIEKRENIPDYVHYYRNPSHEELCDLYQKSDIFIYPSREEGWGLTPIEAMACKCAVVGTKTGCMLDIGKLGENALLSDPKDVDTLTENIQLLINDIELRRKISENGYNTIKKLNWKNAFDKFEKEVSSVEIKNS
ncbi:glycosyltransferase family 4 protein [Clostridium butyricum]|uniref:Glycosyltransferase n=1 Tax=Clostridium butyricum TaxID=1492 RepID=A0AAD0LEW7_CLOBU|nr:MULTISPECIES: glycosyltransferase family 4 protein [Clostridium]AXB85428.1 glycosyltransferase [Clostridium butyricum]MBS4839447.1 glycosyltransferase family 4 protein [Clostridium sp.]MCQ2018042.1 glycosyltransferase family 4 protein [Clostridium butyricum]MCQ2022988.1 glycosyltransferase family 4 protein [Clostridium butyricum]MDB2160785.1 glycosyltransferase family 4 protein [Clostridium butyricum]